MSTTFETEHCTGCRTCEIACSYHHQGVFSPDISSIEIKSDLANLAFTIAFHERPEGGHLACNRCHGLEEPFCVKYCNVLARDELREFLSMLATRKTAG